MEIIEGTDFFENGLCFYCHLAKQELQEYRHFHHETEHSWKDRDEQLQAHIDSILQKYPSSEHDEIVDSYAWELHLNQSRCPDIHRTALTVAICMLVEDQVNGLCEIISRSIATKVKLSDVHGRGIRRALTYLAKVAELDLRSVSSLAFVKNTQQLRNVLVHAGGILPLEKGDALNQFVESEPGLCGEPGQRVQIAPEFIEVLFEQLASFFDGLDERVQGFIRRLSPSSES